MKVCKNCNLEKELYKGKRLCKECINYKSKLYYENNKESRLIYRKQYYENNKEVIKENVKKYESCENRISSKKIYFKKYQNHRIKNDPLFKLSRNIRCLVINSIKSRGYRKNTKTEKILGCSFSEFKSHLESKFEPWMNWNNYGLYNGELDYGWDIDHILPLSSAKTEDDILNLNNYKNLQPLCSKNNRDIKKNNII